MHNEETKSAIKAAFLARNPEMAAQIAFDARLFAKTDCQWTPEWVPLRHGRHFYWCFRECLTNIPKSTVDTDYRRFIDILHKAAACCDILISQQG